MVKSKIFAVILVLIFAFRIWQATGCENFKSFRFNPLSIKINVEEQTSIDVGINRNISRFFHNKISTGFYELTKSYVKIFNPRLLFEILGPIGSVLVILGVANIFKDKVILRLGHFFIVISALLFAILWLNPRVSFYLTAASLFSFTFWGISQVTKTKITGILFIFLVFITFWYFIFSWQMLTVCNQIFFN